MLQYIVVGLYYVDYLNISHFDKPSSGFQRIQNAPSCILFWNLDNPSWVCCDIPRILQEKINNVPLDQYFVTSDLRVYLYLSTLYFHLLRLKIGLISKYIFNPYGLSVHPVLNFLYVIGLVLGQISSDIWDRNMIIIGQIYGRRDFWRI
jgi:hypothetical protein